MQKEKNQTVLERKQQMGHIITPCSAFMLLKRSIWGCSLAPRGTIHQYRVLKWLEILSLQPEVKLRTQGLRPRPRTQKKSEAKAKDSLSEDRHSPGQEQECSRPRPRTKNTSASALQKIKIFTKIYRAISKKKKRSSQKFFKRSPRKNVFQIIFQALHKI